MAPTAPTDTEGRVRTFTDQWLRTVDLPPKPPEGKSWMGRVEWFDKDGDGLGLRVSWTGTKTWFVHYRMPGDPTRKRVILGRYPAITLREARIKAKEATLNAARGTDAASDKAAAKEAPTVEALCKDYIDKYAKPQKRSWYRDFKIVRAEVVPAWGKRKASDIRRRDVVELLEGIRDRGAPIQANRTLAMVRKMFNWALERDLVDANPCAGVKAPSPENRRERVLTDGEIRAVWRACDQLRPVIAATWRLRLLTAQRGGEVLSARWEDMDLDGGWWTIPAARSKNKRSHRVPLSAPSVDLLKQLQKDVGDSPWICPGLKGGHLHELSDATKQIRELSGVDFVPHDLRRTAATNISRLGFDRLTIAKILNHVSADADVTARYDVHQRDQEKRQALDAWAERLMAVVG